MDAKDHDQEMDNFLELDFPPFDPNTFRYRPIDPSMSYEEQCEIIAEWLAAILAGVRVFSSADSAVDSASQMEASED